LWTSVISFQKYSLTENNKSVNANGNIKYPLKRKLNRNGKIQNGKKRKRKNTKRNEEVSKLLEYLLAMSQRSVSQFQVYQQWHSTSSQLLRIRRTLNIFSIRSDITAGTRNHTQASLQCSVFKSNLKPEVSILTAPNS